MCVGRLRLLGSVPRASREVMCVCASVRVCVCASREGCVCVLAVKGVCVCASREGCVVC